MESTAFEGNINDKNIILIGFMGSGKSVTARELSFLLKRRVVSTDALVERREGKSIAAIFKENGEDYFRVKEREAVKEAAALRGIVIDCGGGAAASPENMLNLKRSGRVIYLETSVDVILERVQGRPHRPLLNTADPRSRIRELLSSREHFYREADAVVNTDGKTARQVANEILSLAVRKSNDGS